MFVLRGEVHAATPQRLALEVLQVSDGRTIELILPEATRPDTVWPMLDMDIVHSALRSARVIWRKHALERMLGRGVSRDEVREVLLRGAQIEDYPDDFPFPSGLFLGTVADRSLHVVAGLDSKNKTVYIISVYEPDSDHFESNGRTRRRRQ